MHLISQQQLQSSFCKDEEGGKETKDDSSFDIPTDKLMKFEEVAQKLRKLVQGEEETKACTLAIDELRQLVIGIL